MKECFIVNELKLSGGTILVETPKRFADTSYDGNVDRAKARAYGAYHTALANAYNTDKEYSVVNIVRASDGIEIVREVIGKIPEEQPVETEE